MPAIRVVLGHGDNPAYKRVARRAAGKQEPTSTRRADFIANGLQREPDALMISDSVIIFQNYVGRRIPESFW